MAPFMLPLCQFHFVAVVEGDEKVRIVHFLVMNVDSEWANMCWLFDGLIERDKTSFGIPVGYYVVAIHIIRNLKFPGLPRNLSPTAHVFFVLPIFFVTKVPPPSMK